MRSFLYIKKNKQTKTKKKAKIRKEIDDNFFTLKIV